MDLIGRVSLLVITLVVVFGMVLALQHAVSGGPLTAQQATDIVVSDLQKSYPSSSVGVINVTQSPVQSSAWRITVLLVLNATSPCPSVSIEGFDYPATRLVPSSYNNYTRGCYIYGFPESGAYGRYVIQSPYIAIARSYDAAYPAIMGYVSRYGYANMQVHALLCSNQTNVWIVNYSAPMAGSPLYVLMRMNGTIMATTGIPQC